jgi:hypothetical protein
LFPLSIGGRFLHVHFTTKEKAAPARRVSFFASVNLWPQHEPRQMSRRDMKLASPAFASWKIGLEAPLRAGGARACLDVAASGAHYAEWHWIF